MPITLRCLSDGERRLLKDKFIASLIGKGAITLTGKHRFRFHEEKPFEAHPDAPMCTDFSFVQSDIALRDSCLELLTDRLLRSGKSIFFRRISGVDRGGLHLGSILSELFNVGFVDVRKRPKPAKEAGKPDIVVEGEWAEGMTVMTVEDTVTLGYSTLAHCMKARLAGLDAKDVLCIFSYGIWEPLLLSHGIQILPVLELEDALQVGVSMHAINSAEAENIREYFRVLGWKAEEVFKAVAV